MRLTIESTPTITEIDGVPCRLWRGTTEGGRPVDVYVHRIGSADPRAQEELDRRLVEMPAVPRELADIERERLHSN